MAKDMQVEEEISHIELASLNFDQWILTVALRAYSKDQSVHGMVHVIFKEARGFRYLNEGDMLMYPFPEDCVRKYVQLIEGNGWSKQEEKFGNMVTIDHQEYLVATINECLSVLSFGKPIVVKVF